MYVTLKHHENAAALSTNSTTHAAHTFAVCAPRSPCFAFASATHRSPAVRASYRHAVPFHQCPVPDAQCLLFLGDGGAGGRDEALSSGMRDVHASLSAPRCTGAGVSGGPSCLCCHRTRLCGDARRPCDGSRRLCCHRTRLCCHATRLCDDRRRLFHGSTRLFCRSKGVFCHSKGLCNDRKRACGGQRLIKTAPGRVWRAKQGVERAVQPGCPRGRVRACCAALIAA